jgi:hypothetical protein
LLKLKLLKDYDQTSWLYLKLLLLDIGFNYLVVSWIRGCGSFVSLALLIICFATFFFNPSHGLPWCYPLSPLLFILVAKGLSREIREVKRVGIISRGRIEDHAN